MQGTGFFSVAGLKRRDEHCTNLIDNQQMCYSYTSLNFWVIVCAIGLKGVFDRISVNIYIDLYKSLSLNGALAMGQNFSSQKVSRG